MTNTLLDVRNLSVSIGHTEVLTDISLELARGESLGIVGETGSGKTMTLRAIAGLLPSIGGRISAGSVHIAGNDVTRATPRQRRRHQRGLISVVPQASMSSLDPLQRIGSQIQEAIRATRPVPASQDAVARALESVKLGPTPGLLKSYPHELSGGMRQRVMIALALAGEPQLLLADEPTTALDASVRTSILNLLTELRLERQLGLVIISHDINAIATATDRIVVMYAGRAVESGWTAEIIANPQHPYTQDLVGALPERTPPGYFLPTLTTFVGERKLKAPTPVPQRIKLPSVDSSNAPKQTSLDVSGANFSYGHRQVLFDISFRVRAGERVGIVGESGSGKSTLAKLLVGVLPSPDVLIDGEPWLHLGANQEHRREVQLIQQDPFASLSSSRTALSTVTEAVQVTQRVSRTAATPIARDLLQAVGLSSDIIGRRSRNLSGGQCQRVSIARSLAANPTILVADEPTSALDLSVQAQIINLLLTLTTQRLLGLVVVSHDLAVIRHLTDRVVVMHNGRIVEEGTTDQILHHPEHPYTQQLCASAEWLQIPSNSTGQETLVYSDHSPS